MAGTWLVDGNRIATKIRSASDPERATWKSNPTRSCPNCYHTIDNSDVNQAWPGLPRGVKFDPSDQEIIWHLLTKAGREGSKPHPFINEFIPTIENDDGICYTHPQRLPGVKQDGSVSHFFHRAIKAYNTGTRKRRKIHGDDFGDVRWHKTGKTKPVLLDGVQRGCKKIMVLYMTMVKGGKPEKTNWVMHQYHLGIEEDEKDGEYVISKIFHQQQQTKLGDKSEQDLPEITDGRIVKVDPVTPKSVTPDPPRTGRYCHEYDQKQEYTLNFTNPSAQVHSPKHPTVQSVEDEVLTEGESSSHNDLPDPESHLNQMFDNDDNDNDNDNDAVEDSKWWDGESQYLLNSQQLVEGLSLCDELLQSQSPNRDANGIDGASDSKPCLSVYAQLGAEHLKKDLEECQNLEGDPTNIELDANGNDGASDSKPRLSVYAQLGAEHLKKDSEECQNLEGDPANIELDTPPEFRLSQLEFGSQDSFIAWGGSKVID